MSEIVERLARALAERYRLDRELGAGGTATVYLAHDLKHDRDVAIKVLHPDLGAALGAERFLSELKTTARLQHPHILPLLDSGAADGLLYCVMPFVRGETSRARLERERQLSAPQLGKTIPHATSRLESTHTNDYTSQMTTVSITELKARLSAFIDIVRDGDEVLVTDRGRLIARLVPIRQAEQEEGRREMLLRSGRLRGPTATLADDFFLRARPADTNGESLAALLDERADGR